MSAYFEEIDYQITPLGPISLRRRRQFKLDVDIMEVLLGDEHLMSDLFTVSEIELSRLALAELDGVGHNILVGGLGLGYTVSEVLDNLTVKSVTVIESLAPVIAWHERGILPLGLKLVEDTRCKIVQADFFARVALGEGLDPTLPNILYDGILIDIDHSPKLFLDPSHGGFYTKDGLTKLAANISPKGIFGLWSNDPPDPLFVDLLKNVFNRAWAVDVKFPNPILGNECLQTIYLALR